MESKVLTIVRKNKEIAKLEGLGENLALTVFFLSVGSNVEVLLYLFKNLINKVEE